MQNIKFAGYDCKIEYGSYPNGRTAIRLVGEDGLPVATASCNIPEADIPEGTTFIKDYSENTGILNVLEEAGIVKRTDVRVKQGFVEVPLVELVNAP